MSADFDSAPAGDLELAFELTALARSMAVPRFEAREFAVQTKDDGSPVTEVDVAVETAQRRLLAERRPDHMIIGEELGRTGDSRWCWYLDPIDGTARFVAGEPGWMTIVALAHDEAVLVGVVERPVDGDRWWGSRGGGAFRDGSPIAVSGRSRLAEAIIQDTWQSDLARGNRDHPLTRVAARVGEVLPHRDHSMLAVARGDTDIAVSVGGGPWDYAPLKAIVEAAGGRVTDLAGGERVDAGGIVATNGLLHAEVLALLLHNDVRR